MSPRVGDQPNKGEQRMAVGVPSSAPGLPSERTAQAAECWTITAFQRNHFFEGKVTVNLAV